MFSEVNQYKISLPVFYNDKFVLLHSFCPSIFGNMPSRDYVEKDLENYTQTILAEDVLKSIRYPSAPMLLLDCRPHDEFASSHIHGAINLTLPPSLIMLRRLVNGKLNVSSLINNTDAREQFLKLWKEAILVLYDSESDTTEDASKILNTLLLRLQKEGCNVTTLQGGFQNFQSLFPEWCDSDSSEDSILGLMALHISSVTTDRPEPDSGLCSVGTPPFPVEILPNLYLGNASDSCDWEALEKYDIHYVLNVTPNLPNTFEDTGLGVKYMQIPIRDHWSQNLSSFFPQAITFIDEARKRKLGVLVHCLAGISRSVTITLAYLMHELNIPLNEAYDFVQRRKANIAPNLNFLGQLKDFERQLNLTSCHCPNSSYPCENISSNGSTPDSAIHTEMWT